MTLAEVLEGVCVADPPAPELAQQQVTGLAYDSRKVRPGYLFFAFSGARADGRAFAPQALAQGALAVVSELPRLEGLSGPWIQVRHGRKALAVAAGNFTGHPDRRLRITGITGTNGKTTTSYLVDSILQTAGLTTALVGTIEHRIAGQCRPAVNTTPESLDLFEMFSELESRGGTHVTMEVSSHALALARVYAIQFHTAVFTNLTRDHLDFHRTMEEYFAAKQLLFLGAGAQPPQVAVVNRDDAYGRSLRLEKVGKVIWYGRSEGADIRALDISSGFSGLRFTIDYGGHRYPVESSLTGDVNVSNILAAWGVGISYGLGPEVIARGIAALRAVPGRFERVDCGQPFLVIVDYAHSDDALRNAIQVARGLSKNRVITVFGCGGDRDRSKRPLMGMAAAEHSDLVVLTSDNPRSENPLDIMNDALVGIRRFNTPVIAEPDRAVAIRKALQEAQPGDVVLIAGKGHETYQILKDAVVPFDDRQVARQALRELGWA
jgi:UDP-N-acetylmuramoyl-L-alanyl-D-glutamate--2,6-diaminopimelate ligase